MNSDSVELDKIEAEAADLDSELQGDGDAEQEAAADEHEQPVTSPESHQKTAHMALTGITGMIGTFTGIKYPPDMIDEGAEHIAPLMSKPWARRLLGGEDGPTFLEQYNDEIKAGMWFAGFVVYTAQGVRAGRARVVNPSPTVDPASPGDDKLDPDAPPPVEGGVWDELAKDNA